MGPEVTIPGRFAHPFKASHGMSNTKALPRRDLFLYAIPAAPLSALGLPLIVFLPPYYNSEYGLSLELVGLIFLIGRIWDIITDPVVGAMQDATQTPFGRRRLWMLIGVPVTLFGAWWVFFAPFGTSPAVALGGLLTLYTGYTFVLNAHISFGAELKNDYAERTRIQGWREIFNVSGLLAVLAAPAALAALGNGGPRATIELMGLVILVGLPIAVLITVFSLKEPTAAARGGDFSPKAAYRLLKENALLRRLLATDVFLGLAPGVTGALFVFFTSVAVGLPELSNVLLLVYFLAGLCGVPIWMQLSYRIGKSRTLAAASLYNALAIAVIGFLPRGEASIAFVFMTLAGLAYGASLFLLRALVADLAEADATAKEERRTGLFFGLFTLSHKIGLALSVGIAYPILGWFGFDQALGADNTNLAMTGLVVVFCGLPCLFYGAAAFLMHGYRAPEMTPGDAR